MNKITPFGNNILVKPQVTDTILQSSEGTLCEYGEVLAIGDEVEKVEVGDIIGYTIWGINKLNIKDEKHYIIPEDSRFILGKIDMSK